MPPWKAFAYRLARIVLVLVRDLESGDLTLRAMSLVYTTLLSLVPLLALFVLRAQSVRRAQSDRADAATAFSRRSANSATESRIASSASSRI
jgi:uncharacterized BrkB/YihY/UPF0761 family membrane protein